MRCAIAVLLLAAGCRQLLGFEAPVATTADAAVDADRCGWGFVPHHADPCVVAVGSSLLLTTAGTYVIDTDTGEVKEPGGGTIALAGMVVGATFVVSTTILSVATGTVVRVIGSRGLVVLAWETISIEGTLDAHSVLDARGPGANPPACDENAATPGQSAGTGGGGGGGGGFRGAGGDGGTGSTGSVSNGLGGVGVIAADEIRGGCPGAAGGSAQAGAGGGAVQLTARISIAIAGGVTVGGDGGRGGASDNGGGGGGSGGLVDLEAPAISIAGIVAANGGGGGGGSQTGLNGQPGMPGQLAGTVATGGTGSGGANGGNGSSMSVLDGRDGIDGGDGGGGGGGGAGFIVIHHAAPDLAGILSPPPTLVVK